MSRAPADPLPPERFEEILQARAPVYGLSLSPGIARVLAGYLAELDRWRRRINLTGNLEAEELVDHALEGVLASDLIAHSESLVDIGSGAGLPGMALAIARPDLSVALVEPRSKRASFLRHVVRALALPNVSVVESRIEEVGGKTFAVATTRAVGGFGSWIGGAAFLRQGGRILAWTTDPEGIARELGERFEPSRVAAVPGSARRRIAEFRRRD
jgi:16S rRNA (guanine527-N7)-methyltransferase